MARNPKWDLQFRGHAAFQALLVFGCDHDRRILVLADCNGDVAAEASLWRLNRDVTAIPKDGTGAGSSDDLAGRCRRFANDLEAAIPSSRRLRRGEKKQRVRTNFAFLGLVSFRAIRRGLD